MRPERSKEEQVIIWTGVVSQLLRTRTNQLLAASDLPFPQFIMLQHLSHDPEREWTVGKLAEAFQINQPAVTKTLRKLTDRGWITTRRDEKDARVKIVRISKRGLKKRADAAKRLAPEFAYAFEGWSGADVAELHRLLERLKTFLDEDRDRRPVLPAAR